MSSILTYLKKVKKPLLLNEIFDIIFERKLKFAKNSDYCRLFDFLKFESEFIVFSICKVVQTSAVTIGLGSADLSNCKRIGILKVEFNSDDPALKEEVYSYIEVGRLWFNSLYI